MKNEARKQENPPLNFLQALASLPGGFLNFLALGKITYYILNYESVQTRQVWVEWERLQENDQSPSNGYSS